jgi:hypothetical protein
MILSIRAARGDQLIQECAISEPVIYLTDIGGDCEGRIMVAEPVRQLPAALAAMVMQARGGFAEQVKRHTLRPVDPRTLLGGLEYPLVERRVIEGPADLIAEDRLSWRREVRLSLQRASSRASSGESGIARML